MEADPAARRTGAAMGTTFLIAVHSQDARLLDAAVDHITDLERRWSRFRADSEISILNRTPDVPVIVSPDTFQVVQAALDACAATEGRFDPTVHDAMHRLGYDRSFDEIHSRSPQEAPAPTETPGTEGIVLDEAVCVVTLPTGVRLDLGGIGKGTAADLVTGRLIERGAMGAAVSIGGDLRVRGDAPSRNGWEVTFEGKPLAMPTLRDGGVCTSTVVKRRWPTRTGSAHHLIDPATGRPTEGIESVTVVAATAQQAEVLTKAAMVAGPLAPALLDSYGVSSFIRWAA